MTTKKMLVWSLVSLSTLIMYSCSTGIDREKLSKALVKYDNFHDFSEGLLQVNKDGKWGFIDKSGKEVIPCIYDYVANFSEGLALVRKGEEYGFIDKEGYFIGKGIVENLLAPNNTMPKETNDEIQTDDSQIHKVLGTWSIIPEQDEMGYGLPSITFNKDGSATYNIGDDFSAKGKYTVENDKIHFIGVGMGMDGSKEPIKETFTLKNNTLITEDGSILKQ